MKIRLFLNEALRETRQKLHSVLGAVCSAELVRLSKIGVSCDGTGQARFPGIGAHLWQPHFMREE